jgi:hypothetical protein
MYAIKSTVLIPTLSSHVVILIKSADLCIISITHATCALLIISRDLVTLTALGAFHRDTAKGWLPRTACKYAYIE